MNDDQERTLYTYLSRWPHSLTRRQIDEDNPDQMAFLIPAMEKALSSGEPLSDDIFNLPDDALL
ncbi:MAG: hypothetical protein V2I33_00800 [Kangiellaceae bacterium]|jgi:hypothetical protein|nr:hypothetical protein [Kangiellaceae bacterium]